MLDLLLVAGATDVKDLCTAVHQVKPAVKEQFFVQALKVYSLKKSKGLMLIDTNAAHSLTF